MEFVVLEGYKLSVEQCVLDVLNSNFYGLLLVFSEKFIIRCYIVIIEDL
jgi:hypothetical protein